MLWSGQTWTNKHSDGRTHECTYSKVPLLGLCLTHCKQAQQKLSDRIQFHSKLITILMMVMWKRGQLLGRYNKQSNCKRNMKKAFIHTMVPVP